MSIGRVGCQRTTDIRDLYMKNCYNQYGMPWLSRRQTENKRSEGMWRMSDTPCIKWRQMITVTVLRVGQKKDVSPSLSQAEAKPQFFLRGNSSAALRCNSSYVKLWVIVAHRPTQFTKLYPFPAQTTILTYMSLNIQGQFSWSGNAGNVQLGEGVEGSP